MKFHVIDSLRGLPTSYPYFTLFIDNWDDFGTKCLFRLRLHQSADDVIDVGDVKILQKDSPRTKLPGRFDALTPGKCISLGQSLDFYEALTKALGQQRTMAVLEALQDVALYPGRAKPFDTLPPFRNALLRFNGAQKARRYARSVVFGDTVDEELKFTYETTIKDAIAPLSCSFNFDDEDVLPGRIIGIVGRNAVGKTRLLANLAKDLVQIERTTNKSAARKEDRFSPRRPLFNRVITISYSAFDQFARPESEHASYVYCGIRSDRGSLSRAKLIARYRNNLERIRGQDRGRAWTLHMESILGERSNAVAAHLHQEISKSKTNEGDLSLLSSGQAILTHFITSLLAWIEPGSMVLFDEPETHLHPNAVANLFNVLDRILNEFESYAILATHSPVVLQEIPAKRVIWLEREGNITTAGRLPVETFGESISELTRHVFETVEIKSYYKAKLAALAKDYTFDEVMDLFDGNLSLSAQAFLLGHYARKQ